MVVHQKIHRRSIIIAAIGAPKSGHGHGEGKGGIREYKMFIENINLTAPLALIQGYQR